MDTRLSRPAGPSRRAVITRAAWTVPAIAVASAAPAYANSQSYDLRVQTFQFKESLNWTPENGGTSALYGLGYVTWDVRVCNDGALVAPAGTVLAAGMGMGPYFDDMSLVSGGGLAVNYLGASARYEVPTNYEDDAYFRSYWRFQLGQVPVGCFTLTFKARLRRQPFGTYARVQDVSMPNLESKTYYINTLAALTPPDNVDRNSSNNSDGTDNTKAIRVHVNANASSAQQPGTYTALPQS